MADDGNREAARNCGRDVLPSVGRDDPEILRSEVPNSLTIGVTDVMTQVISSLLG